jgi:HEAT repeat protein
MPSSGVRTPLADDQETPLNQIEKAGDPSSIGLLRQYLGAPDATVQLAAFEKLAAADTASAVQELLEVFRASQHVARGNALRLLVNSPHIDEHVSRAELRRAARDADPEIRRYAAEALAALDNRP